MSTRTFRVTVRGGFDELSDEQRAALQERAAGHGTLHATLTPEGHLARDVAARPAFTFRFPDSGEAEGDDVPEATERAENTARAWLEQRGYGGESLGSSVEDLLPAALGKR